MKKQKTLKELERKANVHYWGLIIALVVMLVITIISLHTENINRELQTQLSECQDKVPVTCYVFTNKTICEKEGIRIYVWNKTFTEQEVFCIMDKENYEVIE